jgi:radical SAM superfamily enzyme YgiQ (UPF0313 family)
VTVLLVVPFDGHRQAAPTLGVGYLKAYAAKCGSAEVVLHDENFLENPDASLRERLAEVSPRFVGISFPSSAVRRVLDIARLVKLVCPRATVFAGGYHPTSEPELTLRLIPWIDFVVRGESELFFGGLGGDWKSLPGAGWIEDGVYRENPPQAVALLDEVPFPDRKIYDRRYFLPSHGVIAGIYGRTATIMTSRGCPYSCRFCAGKSMQKLVRHHGTAHVLAEIDHLLSVLGSIDYLYFIDVMFLSNWQRVDELCEALLRERHPGRFRWAATVAANVVTDEKVRRMKEAGCFYLSFGFESNSSRVLELIGKKATPADNARACEICRRQGIYVNSAFLFGIPGEQEEDLQQTIDFVRTHEIGFTGVNIMRPLPGSPFYNDFVRRGILHPSVEEWHEISSIYESKTIYNDLVSRERYRFFIDCFDRTIRRKSLLASFRANWWKRLKYAIRPQKGP